MTKSKVFLYLCLSFVGGIFIDSAPEFFTPHLFWIKGAGLIFGIFLIFIFWQYKKLVVVGFCLFFLVAGIWRHQTAELGIIHPEEQNIAFTGTIVKEPDIRTDSIKLTIKSENDSEPIKGKILITTSRYPEYQYGDRLEIVGKIKTPHVFEDFNYKNFLAKDGIYSVMYWPEIKLLEREPFSFYGKILQFKDKLRESIYQNLSPPQSSILGAIILGDRKKMSADLKERLNITGLRHITAISGMHIMILSGILFYLGMALRLRRGQAFYFALALLILFIIMVGMPASAVRAGIMGGLFLLAEKTGRPKSASRAIVFAAAGMLAINPLLLRLDVGFQLSFLAVMGIIYLMPSFQGWLKKLPNPDIFPLRNLLSMTLAAQIFTLPILIYNFGYMSSVAPITNILIVPLLPFIMVSGFVFGLAGMLWPPLGWVFSWPCWLLLTHLTKIVDWFSQIPFAALTLENIHWLWLIIAYLILGYFAWRLNEKQKFDRGFQHGKMKVENYG